MPVLEGARVCIIPHRRQLSSVMCDVSTKDKCSVIKLRLCAVAHLVPFPNARVPPTRGQIQMECSLHHAFLSHVLCSRVVYFAVVAGMPVFFQAAHGRPRGVRLLGRNF